MRRRKMQSGFFSMIMPARGARVLKHGTTHHTGTKTDKTGTTNECTPILGICLPL